MRWPPRARVSVEVPAGPGGQQQQRFEDGLRFLATALALQKDHRNGAATLSSACDALKCFLAVLQAAAERHVEDRGGEVARLRDQCEALLNPHQDREAMLQNVLEAARLARDQAAGLLPRLGQA